jgi:hypothetical protein
VELLPCVGGSRRKCFAVFEAQPGARDLSPHDGPVERTRRCQRETEPCVGLALAATSLTEQRVEAAEVAVTQALHSAAVEAVVEVELVIAP